MGNACCHKLQVNLLRVWDRECKEGGIQSESKQSIHCLEDGRDCWWIVIGQELSLISCESGIYLVNREISFSVKVPSEGACAVFPITYPSD